MYRSGKNNWKETECQQRVKEIPGGAKFMLVDINNITYWKKNVEAYSNGQNDVEGRKI